MTRFLALVLFFLVLPLNGSAFGMTSSTPDADALRRSISSNQSTIARVHKEYDALIERRAHGQLVPMVVSRLEQLKNQMAVLVRENERSLEDLTLEGEVPQETTEDQLEEPTSEDSLRGADWLLMRTDQKERYVYTAIGALEHQGVFFMKPASFYTESLDKQLLEDASLADQFLDNLFVLSVFGNEPQARETLKHLAQAKPMGFATSPESR